MTPQTTLTDDTENLDTAFLRYYRPIPRATKDKDRSIMDWLPANEKEQGKKTYAQDWPAYDQAKTNEDWLFKQLLVELTLGTQPTIVKKPGRTGYHQWEKILAMCLKEYYKADLRQTQSILKTLVKTHHLPRAPGYGSIKNFYNDQTLTPTLNKLIFISALPLTFIEEVGSIDSTGFSLYQYQQWHAHKWGKHKGKERVWRKLHAWTGTKTNIFIKAKITEKNVGDAPVLKQLVTDSSHFFNMQEFVADMAYSSRDILEYLHSLGMTPFIPFAKNIKLNSPSKGCPTWKNMLYEFHHRHDEFMDSYHVRSNVETNFHMLKANYGNHLATKNFVANQNELLARILCHNLCVLIQEMHELHITVDFAACERIARTVKE